MAWREDTDIQKMAKRAIAWDQQDAGLDTASFSNPVHFISLLNTLQNSIVLTHMILSVTCFGVCVLFFTAAMLIGSNPLSCMPTSLAI